MPCSALNARVSARVLYGLSWIWLTSGTMSVSSMHPLQVSRLEVGDADRADVAGLQQASQTPHGVDVLPLIRVRPVHHQHVEVVDAQPGDAAAERLGDAVDAVPLPVELRGDEDLVAGDARVGDALPDRLLVAVVLGGVHQPVARLERGPDGGGGLVAQHRRGAEAEHRDGGVVLQREGRGRFRSWFLLSARCGARTGRRTAGRSGPGSTDSIRPSSCRESRQRRRCSGSGQAPASSARARPARRSSAAPPAGRRDTAGRCRRTTVRGAGGTCPTGCPSRCQRQCDATGHSSQRGVRAVQIRLRAPSRRPPSGPPAGRCAGRNRWARASSATLSAAGGWASPPSIRASTRRTFVSSTTCRRRNAKLAIAAAVYEPTPGQGEQGRVRRSAPRRRTRR